MKKIYMFLFLFAMAATTLTACTEEEVKPSKETGNAGGVPIKE